MAAILADRDGIIRCTNAPAVKMFGFIDDEMAGLSVNLLLPQGLRSRHGELVRDFFSGTAGRQMRSSREFTACRKDGTTFPADISVTTVVEDGETFGLACIVDLTAYTLQRTALARTSRALDLLSASNRTLLRATEIQPLLDDVCHIAAEKGGYHLAWIGYAEHDEQKLVHPVAQAGPGIGYVADLSISWNEADERGRGPTGTAIRTGRPVVIRFLMTDPRFAPWRPAALKYGFQSTITLPLRVAGQVFGAFMLYATEPDAFDEDETRLLTEVADDLAFGIETLRTRDARDQAKEELRRLAHADFVTGLPNRAALMEFLDEAIGRRQEGALLFVDLDRFKEINDSQGYLVGDAVLKAVGERLASVLESGEMLVRIGGDEFALVVPGSDRAAAAGAAERLTEALAETLTVGALSVSLGAKIGIAFYPGERATPNEVCANAGLASRESKAVAKGYRFYSPGMSAVLAERREIAQGLKLAMAEGRLQLHYQPKADLRTGRIIGAEALLRWQDPTRGPIGPDRFIPIAEERGLMPDLGAWVLEQACRQLTAWRAAGLHFPGRLAINVSSRQLDSGNFAATVANIVETSGCSAADLELEITESVLAMDGQAAIAMMEEMNANGFVFAVDDFGTGFSSLAYLSRFPAGTLKIDISFVRNMLNNANDHVIVETIIGMAKSLGLATVAEGVETTDQAQALVNLGCMVAQGYHYGRPEPADSFAKLWLHAVPT
jgi:diguanylate cyclase (GGDEF)-like protein/PAS domain S-box-containing protein